MKVWSADGFHAEIHRCKVCCVVSVLYILLFMQFRKKNGLNSSDASVQEDFDSLQSCHFIFLLD